jgi:multiple sugar transport system permease protein
VTVGGASRGTATSAVAELRIARPRRLLGRDAVVGYLWVTPALVLLGTLVAYPFLLALYWSLTSKTAGLAGVFVGLDNFAYLLGSPTFLKTLRNTAVFTAASVAAKLAIGMAAALVLDQAFRGRNLARGIFLLPWIVPTSLSALAWLWIYDDMFGVISRLAIDLGLRREPIPFLSDSVLAMVAVVAVNVWRGVSFFAVSFLAGMQSISGELYEAAESDGAGAARRFWHLTLPGLRPIIAVATLFSVIWTFSDFTIVYIVTRGGPANSTHLLATLAYQTAIFGGKIGEGLAISSFMFPLLVVVIFLQLHFLRRAQE